MIDQKVIIESLAMDLKRVALGSHRGSHKMAGRFQAEALKRINELEQETTDIYLKKLIKNSRQALLTTDARLADDALMYSILFQNFVLSAQKTGQLNV